MAETVHQVWKSSKVVADKFHVIQLFSTSLEAQRKLSRAPRSHKKGRHEQRLLHKRPQLLKEEEQYELKEWLKHDQALSLLHSALQDMRWVYDADGLKEGEKRLAQWFDRHLFSKNGAVKKIAKTILKWRAEIESYFQYRVSNAPMEGTNNKIKVLKRRAYGYRNMRHFETRIRMECKSA